MFSSTFPFTGRSIRTVRKDKQALVVFKEIGLEVNADKTKYMVTSRHQIARQNQNITRVNKSLEKLEQFKCVGTILTFKIPFMTM
jgi:hypothetical protein